MPASFWRSRTTASSFPDYSDACLINRYQTGARLLSIKTKTKRIQRPITRSRSRSAVFLFGGLKRADKTMRVPVVHGDVIVWGGPARLRYHGVLALMKSNHRLLGEYRINLTFRKAG
jgi:alkylated DNA repair protein (DNA oxidative demethylase)